MKDCPEHHQKNRSKDSSKAWEYNFDGLSGPTHNYAGLPFGNLASMTHKNQTSQPKAAALEGLEKMKILMDMGFKQAVLPPHARPDLGFLKQLGLTGNPEQILRKAWEVSPDLLGACYSASSMWAANSAVISPSADTGDRKAHFTPANLQSWLHRSLEAGQTGLILRRIFSDPRYFVHHPPLPSVPAFSDEGAANHSRLCLDYGLAGTELFVYGRLGFSQSRFGKKALERRLEKRLEQMFASRQTREAAQIIALRHQLRSEKTILAEQSLQAIAAGVFHNDVICVADQNLIFCHELAFRDTKKVLGEIEEALRPAPLLKILVCRRDVSLKDAVSSYLFNSQLLPLWESRQEESRQEGSRQEGRHQEESCQEESRQEGRRQEERRRGKNCWLLLAPSECEEIPSVHDYLESIAGNSPIREIRFVPIRESMRNGGGPACLRLRVVLTEQEAAAAHGGVFLDQKLYGRLKAWIERHYRDRIKPEDLLDPLLIRESQEALDELSGVFGLEKIYPFQL